MPAVLKQMLNVSLIFMMTACTSMRPVQGELNAATIRKAVKPGDEIIVITAHTKDRIIVDHISDKTLSGSAKEFNIADIIEIRKNGIDPLKTTALAAGGAFTAWAIAGFITFCTMIVTLFHGG